jgi:hypothetical protein
MFQDAFSITGMLEYGIGNAFSFSVLPDRRNGCFSQYGNARIRYWYCQIAKMDAFSNIGMLKYSIGDARSPNGCYYCRI